MNWNKGDDVIVHPSVSTEEAKTLFPDVTFHKVGVFPAAAEVSEAHEWTIATLPPDNPAQAVKPGPRAVQTHRADLRATEGFVCTCKSTATASMAVLERCIPNEL